MTLAEVILWGTTIGTVMFDDTTGLGSFEYDKDFLKSGIEVSPITMPLSTRVYTFPELKKESFHGLPGLLSDSLPDKFGNAVIDAWLAEQGRTPESFNPVERLCYTGTRGMGALEYVPALGPNPTASETMAVDRLVRIASEILTSRKKIKVSEKTQAMQEILRVGTSAGGARAKAVIAWNENTGEIRSGQVKTDTGFGNWIIKFDGVSGNGDKEGPDREEYTKTEYAYYLMAKDAGITMKECRIYEENGRSHFMTRRFDRDEITGEKIHTQTLGAIAHYDFNDPGVYSYEQAAQIMRRLMISSSEISQFYRRMVFNVIARNRDDHVKNISFIMDRRGKWSLSPAYDVTFAYNPGGMWTAAHQMKINGKNDSVTYEDLLISAKNMGIKKSEAEQITEKVRSSVQKWDKFAETAKLSEKNSEAVSKYFVLL
jgi:serine/threonine-protein kinase HipA